MAAESSITVPERYLRSLEKQVEDLRSLIEVSALISSTLDYNDLMNIVMEKAKKVVDAEACSLLFLQKETNKLEFAVALCRMEPAAEVLKDNITLEMGEGIAGWVAQHKKTLIIEDARSDERFSREADKLTGFQTRSIIAAPLLGRSGLIGVAEILNPKTKARFSQYDAEIFETFCRQIAFAVENAMFHKAALEEERFRKELEIASAVQMSFLPASPVIEKGKMRVSAITVPASEVGGDFYDFVECDNGELGVLIGDVSGKGISAALYMAKMISDFRYTARSCSSPDEVLAELNSKLMSAPRGMFLTCVYIMADGMTGKMRVAVAGHPPFFMITRGEAETVALPAGPPLGIQKSGFSSHSLTLGEKEKLLFITDGAYDAKNTLGERVGLPRLVEFVQSSDDAADLIPMVMERIRDFAGKAESPDDITLLEMSVN